MACSLTYTEFVCVADNVDVPVTLTTVEGVAVTVDVLAVWKQLQTVRTKEVAWATRLLKAAAFASIVVVDGLFFGPVRASTSSRFFR